MKTKTIRQKVLFHAKPEEIYSALMSSRKHSSFTGGRAVISPRAGGNISAYDGYISGKNILLVKNRRIVQSWHASDWPEGHVSKVVFSLRKVKTGTLLTFTHNGVPENHYREISSGWKEYYWVPMKKFLGKK